MNEEEHRIMKKIILLALMLLVAAPAIYPKAKRGSVKEPRIPILAWYSIPPGQFATQERYEELRDAGFTLSFSHIYSYEDAVKALDLCAKVGLKSIFMCPELEKEPEAIARKVKNHPGLGGYFLRDEPGNDALDALGDWARRIQSVDDVHPCYLNLLPEHAFSREGYIEHLRLFIEKVPLPQLSYDHYPIRQTEQGVRLNPVFFDNLELVSKAGRDAGKPFWAFALSTAHTPYPIPTMGHLRLQMYANLCYGAQCLQYFTYWNPGTETWNFHEAPIKQDGQRSPVYELVRQLNAEIQKRAFVFLGSKVEGVYHMGEDIPQGTTRLTQLPPHFKKLDSGGKGALVSLLSNGSHRYVVVQNTSPSDPIDMQIETDGQVMLIRRDASRERASKYGPLFVLEPGDVLIFANEE